MPYLNVDEVESALAAAAAAPYATFSTLVALPNATWEGRQCHALKLANASGAGRPGIYFLGGVHAREWGSSDILINFIQALQGAYLNGTSLTFGSRTFSAVDLQSIINTMDVIIFPQANPDGRYYSQNSVGMWRKNRRTAAPNNGGGDCTGVDINRNYDFLWDFATDFDPASGVSTSSNPCDPQTYDGASAFSEPETRNAQWIFDNFPNVAYFIDLHSYSEDILYSWGDDDNQSSDPTMNFQNPAWNGKRGVKGDTYKEYFPAGDLATALALAGAMHDGIQAFRGKNYTTKSSFDLYPTSGTGPDYAYARHFVNSSQQNVISYTIEWGTEFQPPYSEMQNIIQEITCGLLAFCLEVRNMFLGVPSINGFSPTSGSGAGGTIVVITGSNFSNATAVNFGANSAVTYNVDNDTQITALSPAGIGSVVLSVVTPAGNTTSGADSFSYTAPAPLPQVTAVSPATGSTAGGTAITITGSGFTGATAVAFGPTQAANFSVDSDTQITATSPASPAGTVDISVSGPAGSSAAVSGDHFVFVVPAPVVTGISPASGPAAGGAGVTVTGTAFTGATSVSFGAAGATFTVASDTSITATSPAGSGTQDVVVTTPAGTSAAVIADQFTYIGGAPAVTAINPQSGSQLGGDIVVITGAGFTGATSVGFGVTSASAMTVDSDTQITATSPPGSGIVDVTVITPAGTSAPVAADQFTYGAPGAPQVTGLNPAAGSEAGGDSMVITGTGFAGATAVTFGGNAAANFTVNSDVQITASTPAGTGMVDVIVSTASGSSAVNGADQFTYNPPALPAVTGVSPNTGPSAGGGQVVISGTGFTGATTVGFGNTGAFFSVDSDVQITATAPGGTGTVDVTVVTAAGTSVVNSADQFTYT